MVLNFYNDVLDTYNTHFRNHKGRVDNTLFTLRNTRQMLISIAMQCKNFMCSTYKKRILVDSRQYCERFVYI